MDHNPAPILGPETRTGLSPKYRPTCHISLDRVRTPRSPPGGRRAPQAYTYQPTKTAGPAPRKDWSTAHGRRGARWSKRMQRALAFSVEDGRSHPCHVRRCHLEAQLVPLGHPVDQARLMEPIPKPTALPTVQDDFPMRPTPPSISSMGHLNVLPFWLPQPPPPPTT